METIIQKLYVGGTLATIMVGLCGFLLRRYVKQQDEEDKKLHARISKVDKETKEFAETLFKKLDQLRGRFEEKSDEISKTINEETKKLSNDISKLEGYLNGREERK